MPRQTFDRRANPAAPTQHHYYIIYMQRLLLSLSSLWHSAAAYAPWPSELEIWEASEQPRRLLKETRKFCNVSEYGLKGDYAYEACSNFCKQAKASNHCRFCKCRACAFCKVTATESTASSSWQADKQASSHRKRSGSSSRSGETIGESDGGGSGGSGGSSSSSSSSSSAGSAGSASAAQAKEEKQQRQQESGGPHEHVQMALPSPVLHMIERYSVPAEAADGDVLAASTAPRARSASSKRRRVVSRGEYQRIKSRERERRGGG